MACLNDDGTPNEKGLEVLKIVSSGENTAKDISKKAGMTLPRVRQRLRSLGEAGYLKEEDGTYVLTDIAKDLDL